MKDRIHFSQCTICNSPSVKNVLLVKDYTVSKEFFEIWECSNCSFRFTQDIPAQEEIGKYYQSDEYISHSDTQKGLINSIYHRVRKITLSTKRNLIEKYAESKNGKLLDVGCGTGAFLHEMKVGGWQVQGIEPDEGARTKAFELYGLNVWSSEKIFELPAGEFDAITLWHVLEHVHQLHEYLSKLREALKPGATIFIAVPNYSSRDAVFYGEYWAAYDVPRHLYHFAPDSMKRLLRDHQFELKAIEPMWYDSYYVSLLSEKYKNGKSNYMNAVMNGWKSNQEAKKDKERASSLIYIAQKPGRA